MSDDELGLWVFVGATGACIIAAIFVTYVHPIDWFRERLLSGDRWTGARGMLPIAFPIYIVAGVLFSIFRR